MDYLMHRSSGWTKKNHKYIDKYFKNGKWVYVYNPLKGKGRKQYSGFDKFLGRDIKDDIKKTEIAWDYMTKKYDGLNQNIINMAQKHFESKEKYKRTPLSHIEKFNASMDKGKAWLKSKATTICRNYLYGSKDKKWKKKSLTEKKGLK